MPFQFDTKEDQEERATSRAARPGKMLGHAVGADTEIALGTRSLLGIFFGLVLICSIFFGLGYSVGRAGGSRTAAQTPDVGPVPDSHRSKPSAEQTLTPVEPPATTDGDPGTTTAGNTPSDSTQSSQPAPVNTAKTPASMPSSTPAATPPAAQPPVLAPAAATVTTTFMVQVAAVRIQQDAQILVDALKRHGYTAVIRNEPQDQLLHIQLGPYNSRGDAMAVRAKLLADGYNAVIK